MCRLLAWCSDEDVVHWKGVGGGRRRRRRRRRRSECGCKASDTGQEGTRANQSSG